MRSSSSARRLAGIVVAVGALAFCTGSSAVDVSSPPAPGAPVATSIAAPGGTQFVAGTTVDVSDDVDGDVFAAGQSVTISGDITGDVIAAGQSVTITGDIDGDVRIAAQDVTISGQVSRSGTIAASDITLDDSGSIGKDVVAAAERIDVIGSIGRDALLIVDRLAIDGSVGGDVTYTSSTDARIVTGAVDGGVERIEPSEEPQGEVSPVALFVGWLLSVLYSLVALSLITLLTAFIAPRWMRRVTDRLIPTPWRALLVGLVASVAVPVALLFLLVTIVGAPLAFAGILVWTLLTLATFVYVSYYLGRLVFRDRAHPALMAVVGGVILIIGLQIPWLNVLVWIAMVLFGLGAQLLEIHSRRPWERVDAPVTGSVPATPTDVPAA